MTEPIDRPVNLEALGIANALIKARNELGLTQAQLSESSGISRSAIKGYETGRNMPGTRELKALCLVLKVSPNQLLFGTETPFDGEPPPTGGLADLKRLMASDPDEARLMRVRLAMLASSLTTDEMASVYNIIHALAVARHGGEVVQQQLDRADVLTGLGIGMQNHMVMVAEGKDHPEQAELEAQVDAVIEKGAALNKALKRSKDAG